MPDVKLAESLLKALQYECRVYDALLGLAEKKTEYLVANDADLISGIVEEESQLVEQGKQLAMVREQYAAKLNAALNIKQEASLEEVEALLPDALATQMASVRIKLKETVMKLMVRNGINQKLIEKAMEYINFNLELMASPSPEVPTYSKSGAEASPGGKRSMLDIRY